MRELIWTRGAEADLQAMFESEEGLREGAGEEFAHLIIDSLDLLKLFPEMAPVYMGRIRRLRIRNRIHGVFYSVEAKRIIIHAVADLRRDPKRLRERFRRFL